MRPDRSTSPALVPALLVRLYPLLRRVPLICPPDCAQPSALRCNGKRVSRKLRVREGAERYEPVWPCQAWEEEPVDSIGHPASEDLCKRSGVVTICAPQRVQIPRAVPLVNDGRRIPVSDKQEVRREPTDSSIAVTERRDSFEASVELAHEEHDVLFADRSSIGIAQPIRYERRDFGERRRRHSAGDLDLFRFLASSMGLSTGSAESGGWRDGSSGQARGSGYDRLGAPQPRNPRKSRLCGDEGLQGGRTRPALETTRRPCPALTRTS